MQSKARRRSRGCTSKRTWQRRRAWRCEFGFHCRAQRLGHKSSCTPCSHSYTQTTHAQSTVRLRHKHSCVSNLRPARRPGVYFLCAISGTNRLAEEETGGRTAVLGGWRGMRSAGIHTHIQYLLLYMLDEQGTRANQRLRMRKDTARKESDWSIRAMGSVDAPSYLPGPSFHSDDSCITVNPAPAATQIFS